MADGDEDVLKEGEGEAEKPGKSVEDELGEMRAELERERAARGDAERRASEAGGRVAQSQEEVRKSHLTTMGTAIEVLTQQKAQLRAARAVARAEGDEAREAEIEDQLMDTTIKINEISKGKTLLETQPVPQPRRSNGTPHADPVVEGVASTLQPKSADWIRAHPEYARDNKLLNKMKAAHFEVVAEIGDEAANNETPEYFAAVEKKLGIGARKAATNGDAAGPDGVNVVVSDAAAPTRTREASTQRDIQPSPAPGNAGSPRTRTVRLTAEQQEAAKINHMSPEEYAKYMLAEKDRGKTTH